VFPHAIENGAGDAGLGFDANGVLYYSSIFFSYTDCRVGGIELLRKDPSSGTWAYAQVADNGAHTFNDKPAVAVDDRFVYQAWTQFNFCPRQEPPDLETLKVAISPQGPTPAPPIEVLDVPGARHTEGAAIAPDGHGGFWLTWEEFQNNLFTQGQIRLIHYNPDTGWSPFRVISPDAFKDLPIPLPGFRFTTNSFPMMAIGSSGPMVVWCSFDSGVGRTYLWSNGTVEAVKDSGGHQFFPAIVAAGDRTWITFSETNQAKRSFGQYLVSGGRVQKVSTKPSLPNQDPSYLHGLFIGDYNGITLAEGVPVPIWADVRPPHFWINTMVFVR
jgi:hypothetical protein